METFEIIIDKNCLESTINDFEKEYLKKNLEEIFVKKIKTKK